MRRFGNLRDAEAYHRQNPDMEIVRQGRDWIVQAGRPIGTHRRRAMEGLLHTRDVNGEIVDRPVGLLGMDFSQAEERTVAALLDRDGNLLSTIDVEAGSGEINAETFRAAMDMMNRNDQRVRDTFRLPPELLQRLAEQPMSGTLEPGDDGSIPIRDYGTVTGRMSSRGPDMQYLRRPGATDYNAARQEAIDAANRRRADHQNTVSLIVHVARVLFRTLHDPESRESAEVLQRRGEQLLHDLNDHHLLRDIGQFVVEHDRASNQLRLEFVHRTEPRTEFPGLDAMRAAVERDLEQAMLFGQRYGGTPRPLGESPIATAARSTDEAMRTFTDAVDRLSTQLDGDVDVEELNVAPVTVDFPEPEMAKTTPQTKKTRRLEFDE